MATDVFKLGDVYRDSTTAAQGALRIQGYKRQVQDQDTYRATGRQAVDEAGKYDADIHAQLLERAGLIDQAQNLRKLQRDEYKDDLSKLKAAFDLVDKSIPVVQGLGDPAYKPFKRLLERSKLVEPGVLPENYDEKTGQLLDIIRQKTIASKLSLPSNLVEWNTFNKMNPGEQAQYLNMKRAGQIKMIGDVPHIVDPVTNQMIPLGPKGTEGQSQSDIQNLITTQQADKAGKIESAKTKARLTETMNQKFQQQLNDADNVTQILDLAEPYLDIATESLGGAAVDTLGRLVGVSNEGARAAASLKTLAGALILKMPRMEGPQSDADQLLYRQMAAEIGDATVPAETRKAAMETLRMLQGKYKQQATGAGAASRTGGNNVDLQNLSDQDLLNNL